jgi:hypothetical protein
MMNDEKRLPVVAGPIRNRVAAGLLGAALLLVLGGGVASGQAPGEAPVVADTVPPGELPPEIAEPIAAFYNDPATIHFSGRTRIPAERTVLGDVAVLGGPLIVAGRVDGQVVVIDGDVELLPGAVITGDLTVVGGSVSGLADATVGGGVATYEHRLRYRRRGDQIALDPEDAQPREAADRFLARSDFLIATGRSYNRVEGLPITFGPVIETASSNPLRLRALAIYRTESGASLDPERLGYYLRVEQSMGGFDHFRIGGTLHSLVDPIEDWHVMNLENSLSTFLFHRDFRDHYEREGWSAFATLGPRRQPWELSLVARWERHRSLPAGSPWTLFRNQETWRSQPLAGEGKLATLAFEGRYDTRSPVGDPAHGWLVTGSLERPLHSGLVRPGAVVAGQLPIAEPVVVPGEEFPGWIHGVIDVRRYNRLGPESRVNLRLLAGGSLDGSPLPPQRQHALGGEGSLPGYALFRFDCGARAQEVYRAEVIARPITSGRVRPPLFVPAYGCDRFALFQAEYRGTLALRFRWGDNLWGDAESRGWDLGWTAAPEWVAFVNAGRAWSIGRPAEDPALDFGAGLLFNRVGVYGAFPLIGEGGLNLFVRLGPRF